MRICQKIEREWRRSGCPHASRSWNYDRYGNRWSQAVTAGTAPTPSAPFTGGSNRMDGWSYDAAGNLLYDGAHHYSYDAEGRLISVDGGATASYVYDAEGRRVRRTAGTFVHDLLYDLDGHVMTEMEYDSNFNGWSRGEIYAGGRHLATYVDGTTYFDHGDWLGTERLRTRLDGSLYETCVSLPYGDALNCTFPNGADTDDPLHFTGQPRDPETGLDDFGFRYGSSTLGRFLTPDDGSDQDPNDPQSWNLYSYVRNNPVNNVDPDGHDCVYLNDTGNAAESIDNHSSPAECQATGGAWADGTITNVTTDPNSNNILIQTAQLDDNGNVDYVTTETAPGQWSPGTELDQVAVGINALHPDDFIATAAAGSATAGGLSGGLLYAMSGPGVTMLGLEAPGAGQAIRINPNDLIHIFGKTVHTLGGIVATFGSERAAYTAIVDAAQKEVASRGITGVFEITLDIAGEPVTVRGKAIDGIVKVGTAFIK